jgi:hypothetical protein
MSDRDHTADRPTAWTEGVCDDGAAILRDGVPVTIPDLLSTLNRYEGYIDNLERRIRQARAALGMGVINNAR